MQGRMPELLASIDALVASNRSLAFARVPSGITAYFGESLGWPDWVLDGTGFTDGRALPRRIRLVDGLRALANLVAHEGEARLAALMLDWPRFPLEAEALAAPDLDVALGVLVERLNARNPTFHMDLVRTPEKAEIRVLIEPSLGAFRPFYEHVLIVWLFMLIRSFLGMSADGRSRMSEMAIGRVHSDATLDPVLGCKRAEATGEAFVAVPASLLACRSPDFDPRLWAGVLAAGQGARAAALDNPEDAAAVVEDVLLHALEEHGRVPQFAEIARSLDRSERTLTRILAQSGQSYRELVDRVRMAMAQDLLLHGDLAVHEVAERLGYGEVSAFVRAFRRGCGVPPHRWRVERQRG